LHTNIVKDPSEAADYILRSEVVAFPTETVYGLGANVFDEKAVRKIFKLKKRPSDNPLIVHVSSISQVALLSVELNELALTLIQKFFPGPLTVIVKKNDIVPNAATAGLDTIAIRMPSSWIAQAFIKECGVPIAAPSANLSGSPSATGFEHVLNDFSGKIPCILIGPRTKYGIESTVVDCTSPIPAVLRPGVVTLEELKEIDKRISYRKIKGRAKSPGTKYKHYAPKARVKLLRSFSSVLGQAAYIGIDINEDEFKDRCMLYKNCIDEADYARNLFSFFRQCDIEGINTIYAQTVEEKGIGLAIMNRLKKAAGLKI
jgi:L-threonylcarbamoyladenylate synthase